MTNTAKATFELEGEYHWCLSGTPLQNRVGELYSLIRFLGGDPFSYYFCEVLSLLQACSILIQTIKVNVAIANRYTGNSAIRLRVTVKFNPFVLVLFI